MPPHPDLNDATVLVTGAGGFLGSRTVARLSEQGCRVRALVRHAPRTEHLKHPNVSIVHGDVSVAGSLNAAFEGVNYVIHAAADTTGSREGGKSSTINGTKNILELCEQYHVKKLVYISTCNVYAVAEYRQGQVITEESSLEQLSEKRGPYTYAKVEAEKLVTAAIKSGLIPIVCLRPGTIYGPGAKVCSPMIGFSMGKNIFAVIGDGRFILPLVYVDNLVEAIITVLSSHNDNSSIYNVVDQQKVTKKEYMEGLVKKLYPGSHTIYIPLPLLKTLVLLQEKLFEAIRKPPFLSSYRLVSSQNTVVYDASKIRKDLAWTPTVSVEDAFNAIINHERNIQPLAPPPPPLTKRP